MLDFSRDLEDVGPEHPDDLELRLDMAESMHDYDPDPQTGKCRAYLIRHGVRGADCGSTQSHAVFHNPKEGCCYCRHGVYLHTDYDIPCGACEFGDYDE